MGKDVGFHMVSRKAGSDFKSENQKSHLANIINKVDVQTSKLVIIDAKNGIYGT